MYDWRKMTPEDRADALKLRQTLQRPWHGPPVFWQGNWFHWSAACYEHKSLIGQSPARMLNFSKDVLKICRGLNAEVGAWVVLPNHYHILLCILDETSTKKIFGRLHGASSHAWNVEENQQGRKCFHRGLLKPVKSEAHRWSTLHYIHHNPVKHGLVEKWQDWPYSSAIEFLKHVGRDEAQRLWKAYPITGMGKNWDDFPVE